MSNKNYTFSVNVSNRIKAIAIIGIVFYHMISCSPDFVEQFGIKSLLMDRELLMYVSDLGKIFVSVFVFISAYGICVGLNSKKDIGDYLTKRIKKLYFSYLVVFLLVQLYACFNVFVLGRNRWAGTTYAHENVMMSIVYFIVDALGLSSAFGTPDFCRTWWYMSIAFALIGIIPIMKQLYDKYGLGFVAIMVVSVVYFFRMTALSRYLIVIMFGIMCAKHHTFEKWNEKHKLLKYLLGIFVLILCITARYEFSKNYMFDAVATVVICYLIYSWTQFLGPINKGLEFIGKHSMNIFLVSTPVYSYFFKNLTYISSNWAVCVLVCMVYSIVISILIEWLKKQILKIKSINQLVND
ncbi:MAG: acyltransferase [Longicatena sp.]|nr:acyltransferase [Longicatena sp.]